MTVFVRPLSRLLIGRTIVQCQVCDVVISFQLLQHVVSADLATLIDGMKQFGF